MVVRDDVRSGNAIIQNDASGDNCIVLYPGANRAIDRDFVDQVLDGYGKGDWLLLQNEISELPISCPAPRPRHVHRAQSLAGDSRLDEVDLDAIGFLYSMRASGDAHRGRRRWETLIRAMRARFSQRI
ncbi:hypothetical protein [Bifidobacterium longum]|uniref:hypothetical protein n=1 Tax=Bifidobacterium longum TaxID=216816 RepID=UPI001D02AAED|nr:hypothetical protein [Bifidobacterium longum]